MNKRLLASILMAGLLLACAVAQAGFTIPVAGEYTAGDEVIFVSEMEIVGAPPSYPPVADRTESGVIYEVFVRSFADGDGDGVGDIRGLMQKLDYLDELGVDTLWLMPIFASPSYHGYDVTDYRAIDPEYGTLEDFQELIADAHGRGIRVLLDLPINHTSIDHPWFTEKPDWYVWADASDPLRVKNTSYWRPKDGRYYYAYFATNMPDLNYDNDEVRAEMISIASYWLNMGVDGFRLDAASHIYGQGERDNYQATWRSGYWWREFKAACEAVNPDALLMGEAWDALSLRLEILPGMDGVFNFDVGGNILMMVKGGGSGPVYVQRQMKIYEEYAKVNPDYIDLPFLTNHDQNRTYGVASARMDRAKMAASMILTLPGKVIVYYGEEIAMQGAKPDEEIRTPMLWGSDDPLQTSWRDSVYNKNTVPVAEQTSDPDSMLSHYRALIAMRAEWPALIHGEMAAADVGNNIVAAYTLTYEGQTVLVVHNFSRATQKTTEGTMEPYTSIIRLAD